MKSQSARASKAIKAELKKVFPTVKFSVSSDNFAGGDAVRIKYVDGPLTESVQNVVSRYQYGSFNSFEDIYEIDNKDESIDQVKYVTVSRTFSDEARAEVAKKLRIADDDSWNEAFRDYNSAVIWRELRDKNFIPMPCKVYEPVKESDFINCHVPELNANVYLETFNREIKIDWQWAALYENRNSANELIGLNHCAPVNSRLRDVVKIKIR